MHTLLNIFLLRLQVWMQAERRKLLQSAIFPWGNATDASDSILSGVWWVEKWKFCSFDWNIPFYHKDQHTMCLLGKISAAINTSESTCKSKKKEQKQRERVRLDYCLDGKKICRETFRFIHMWVLANYFLCICNNSISNRVGHQKLNQLIAHYKTHWLVPKEKKNAGRANNKRALTYSDIERTRDFIQNYAATHALVLPGRVPGYKRDDIKLLPSSHTKKYVFEQYKAALSNQGKFLGVCWGCLVYLTVTDVRVIGLSSFKGIWRSLLPDVVACRPMTDLCATCQMNNYKIYRSSNLEEEEKWWALNLFV